jgi:hypothetical protein
METYIYKTVFTTELEGKIILENKGVWKEVNSLGPNILNYINGTKSVAVIGKVIKTPATYAPDGTIITPPVYYPGIAYDIMSTDVIDFGSNEVYPGDFSVHSFSGWARNSEVPPSF